MDRVRSIDNDIMQVDDEIEDAVMRARERGGGTEGGFNQRPWGSAVTSTQTLQVVQWRLLLQPAILVKVKLAHGKKTAIHRGDPVEL